VSTRTTTVVKNIQLIRYHSMEIRRLRARLANGEARNSSTSSAMFRHEEARAAATRKLVESGLRDLAKLLVEEANLRQRMRVVSSRDPLCHRLDSVLQDIRQQIKRIDSILEGT